MGDFGALSDTIVTVPLRPDVQINIQGIPFDLTQEEAEKLATIVHALALKPTHEQAKCGHQPKERDDG